MSIKNYLEKLKAQDSRSSLRSSSGQALIETLLLLVVGIALATILLNSFFGTAFEDWGENQFGSYLQCLLESGELPALGGSAGACNNEYVAFGQGSGAGGGPGGPGTGGQGPGSGGDGGDGNDGGGRAGAPNQVPIAGDRRAGGRGRFGSSRRFGMGGFGSGAGGDGGGEGGAAQQQDSPYTGSTDAGLPTWATQRDGQRTEIRRRGQQFAYYDSLYSAEQQKEKEEGNAVTVKEEKVNSQDAQRPQSMLMTKRAPTSAPPPEDDDEWTFGAFIKYIIIIAIIIGIILFLGSQLLQIKNSME